MMLLEVTQVSLTNSMSYHSTAALTGCTSVTDGPRYGDICHSSQH